MSFYAKQRAFFTNPFVQDAAKGIVLLRPGLGLTPGLGAKVDRHSRLMSHEIIDLSAVASLALTSSVKFAGYAALTFPNANLLLHSAHLKGGFVIDTAGQVASNYKIALGSAVTATATFTNAAENSYMTTRTPTGAAVTGTIDFSTVGESSPVGTYIKAGASNQMFINVGFASLAASVHLTFSAGSFLEVYYWDLESGT